MQEITKPWTAGDLLPEITCALNGVNITGYTITLHIARPTTVLVKTATIIDAPTGLFKFAWSSGDLVAGALQLCEIEIVDGSSRPLTSQKFTINVDPQIA